MKTETKVEKLNLTFTVTEKMQIYIMLLEKGDSPAKAFAREEMMEIAKKLQMLYVDGIGKPNQRKGAINGTT